MRIVNSEKVTEAVKKLCIDANIYLGDDIKSAYKTMCSCEKSEAGREVLNQLSENAELAAKLGKAVCQDTGMAVVFVEIGEEVFIEGNIEDAVNEGVRQGYKDGYLRKSIVRDPIHRGNTNDNTPAIIHISFVKGDTVKIIVAPKGFGSENMSRIKMLAPADGVEAIIDFVIETVEIAGPNPCPPIVVGVGIGGNFEYSAYLAKKALMRKIGEANINPYYADLEKLLLEKVNQTGIGPQGYGGITTALGVFIETFPTHIAGMPVAVNISCHVNRHKEAVI